MVSCRGRKGIPWGERHGGTKFRPSLLAKSLTHLGFVNIGAAGTFVVRKPIARSVLRAEILRRMPFETCCFRPGSPPA